ncbi:CYTH domain-containing protein [Roseateles chitosanitabidus]|uniref:CYTH domain-containing protein n=1 Tax=Roseateles chitosanitabidus TaxID=65048 RepID=UPI00082FE6E9|nr:CYTH domain-containing protein [Roseateles chitosanitabidus]MBO9687718.1 CYTH and CHAD domain-containing protein [Roseateles chitosanitabidus]
MNEIELRFQIPESQWPAVRRWVAGDARSTPVQERLQASYFDTVDRDLAHAGFALRLRREGEVWVQTLKGAAPDGMTRLEHNVPLGAEAPTLDVARHADHPAGQALQQLLARLPEGALQPLFRTDITRLSRSMRTKFGTVELALDHGALLAGEGDTLRSTPVSEVEIELKSGEARAVLEVARQWAVERFGLTLELRTKALRGDLLARQLDCAPVSVSSALHWTGDMSRDDALHVLLRESLEPIVGNASQIASGRHQPEHLHQLRVGLRRLRAGLRLLAEDGDVALQALADGAGALSRDLTVARDADAQAEAAWRVAMLAAWHAERPSAAVESGTARPVDVAALLHARNVQGWMLAIIGWLARPAPETHEDLAIVHARIDAWRAAADQQIKRFDRLDTEGRHHLRRRLRKIRLALELAIALPGGAAGARLSKKALASRGRLLAQVHEAQQRLGALNDLEVGLAEAREQLALAMARGDVPAAAQAGFALGYLRPRQAQALEKAAKAVGRVKPVGRKG